MEEVEMYVTRHQIIVAKFIMTRPIIDLCLVEERHLGVWVFHQWQEREVLEGMRSKTKSTEMEFVEEEEDGEKKD